MTWLAIDTQVCRDHAIVELGEQFGPAGPLTWIVLLVEMKERGTSGRLTLVYRDLAHLAFYNNAEQAHHILQKMVDLELVTTHKASRAGCTVEIPRWHKYQRDARTQLRQVRRREALQERDTSVTERDASVHGHGTGTEDTRDVAEVRNRSDKPKRKRERNAVAPTKSGATRTGTASISEATAERSTGSAPRNGASGASDKRSPAVQARLVRELFDYWRERCGHPAAKLTADRQQKIRARLREGYSPDLIRRAIDGAAVAAYENDEGKRFDDVELICRKGSKLEDFAERADQARRSRRNGRPTAQDPEWHARKARWAALLAELPEYPEMQVIQAAEQLAASGVDVRLDRLRGQLGPSVLEASA